MQLTDLQDFACLICLFELAASRHRPNSSADDTASTTAVETAEVSPYHVDCTHKAVRAHGLELGCLSRRSGPHNVAVAVSDWKQC